MDSPPSRGHPCDNTLICSLLPPPPQFQLSLQSDGHAVSSITRGPRQSNFELLRIVAMMMVLVLHADFWAIGSPSAEEWATAPGPTLVRTLFEAMSIVAVNVFVLISGWFGIRPTVRGLAGFLFQCLFFEFLMYAVAIGTGVATLSLHGVADCLFFGKLNWFIKAYVALYIISPLLNLYCRTATRSQMLAVTAAFYLFQSIWGWTGATLFISDGYSAYSFIGLYLLARCLRCYTPERVAAWGGAIYWAGTVCTVGLVLVTSLAGIRHHMALSYASPAVVVGAAGLVLWFSRLHIGHNRFINWVAASAFAAYLTHTATSIVSVWFLPYFKWLYASYSGMAAGGLYAVSLAGIFAASIVLDQPRKWLWRRISARIWG